MNTFKKFVVGRLKSFGPAFRGMFILLKSEHSIITQFLIFLVAIALGIYFKISKIEWIIQIMLFGMVMGLEGANTAVEKICDFIHPDYHDKIKLIKDIAAGSVNIAAFATGISIIIIYYSYIFN